MLKAVRHAAGLLAVLFATPTMAAPDLPLAYTLSSPLYGGGDLVIRVHQTPALALARVMAPDQADFYEQADAGVFNPGVANTYIAGELTAERLGKFQNMGRPVFEVRDAAPLQPGERYPHPDQDGVEWQVDDLEISMERGDSDRTVAGLATKHYVVNVRYDYRRFDTVDGEENGKQVNARREFWFAEALPFSPVQLLPLSLGHSTFATHAPERIQQTVYERLEAQMRRAGMLVRARLKRRGESVTIGVSELRTAPAIDLSALQGMPIIPSSIADAVTGPLFLSRILSDRMVEGGSASLTFARDDTGGTRKVEGRSAFTVSKVGDAVIASTFDSPDGAQGMLVLMRPYHGRPEPGTYETAARLDRKALGAMDRAAVRERARRFQAFGLIEDEQGLSVYTSANDGQVVLDRSGEDGVAGSYSLRMKALDALGGGTVTEREIAGSFEAVPNLKLRMRSPSGRRLQ